METYDSAFLSQARDNERQVAALEERVRSLQHLAKMPDALAEIEEETIQLKSEEERLRRKIQEERKSLQNAMTNIEKIEQAYLQILRDVGVPGIRAGDTVKIEQPSWIPAIYPGGDEGLKWDFFNAGSGGKATLLNVCYALAVHKVAAENNLPLPTLLIIDSPMKNISEDVNRDIFVAFYNKLYTLARDSMSKTQFVIVDKEFIPPVDSNIEVFDRYMTPSDPQHPPLISYYQGP
jgi:hypothetical protein